MIAPQSCTSEQAVGRVQYLRHAFGGYAIPDTEDRALVRLFLHFSPEEITRVIDRLLLTKPERRPGPSELAEGLKELRCGPDPKVHEDLMRRFAAWDPENPTPYVEPVNDADPDEAKRHLDAIRERNPALSARRR